MDNLFRYITADGSAVLSILDSTEIIRAMEQYHHTSATSSAALGRVLTITSLIGYGLKDDNCSLTLLIKGNGPIGSITAVSDWKGNVRGYCDNPFADLPENSKGKLDVGGVVGQTGTLYVIKDLGLDTPYIGQVELVNGEIAEDIAAYFAYSEQIPTVCALGVLVNTDLSILNAGGFLLQLLPGASEEIIDQIEENISHIPPMTQMLSEGMSIEKISRVIMGNLEYNFLDSSEAGYRCNCSRERMEKVLISLGKEELTRLAEEQKDTEIVCHFCNQKYHFSDEELIQLIKTS